MNVILRVRRFYSFHKKMYAVKSVIKMPPLNITNSNSQYLRKLLRVVRRKKKKGNEIVREDIFAVLVFA